MRLSIVIIAILGVFFLCHGMWPNDVILEESNTNIRFCDLVFDSNDIPHIAFTRYLRTDSRSNRYLSYTSWNGYSWEFENIDSSDVYTLGHFVSIDVTNTDLPCLFLFTRIY